MTDSYKPLTIHDMIKVRMKDFVEQPAKGTKMIDVYALNERVKALMDAFNNWRHESDERLELLQKEQNRADNAVKDLRLWHPKAYEVTQIKEQLQKLEVTEKENAARQTAVKSQIAQITTEFEMIPVYELKQVG